MGEPARLARSAGRCGGGRVPRRSTGQPTVGQPHLGASEHAMNTAIVQGLVASQDEPGGWHAVVGRALRAEDVQRLDDRTMLIDLKQQASYDIVAPETLVALVPGDAVLSRRRPSMPRAAAVR